MRRVIIGTPCYGGSVHAEYANSLAISMLAFGAEGIQLRPQFSTNHSVVQMARNLVLNEALNFGFDDLIWIDSDIQWNPDDLLRLCQYKEDVVAATYRKKSSTELHYTVQCIKGKDVPDVRGLMEVSRIGAGFLRVSRKAIDDVIKNCVSYFDGTRDIVNVFEIGLRNKEFLSEDFFFCEKLKEAGYKIMLDTNMNLIHHGAYGYCGEFSHFLDVMKARRLKEESETKT